MTRETKVGLLMVALLVGVFGFLVYQRIHRPAEGLAEQDSPEIRTNNTDNTDDVSSKRDDNEFATFERSDRSGRGQPAAPMQLPDVEFASPVSETNDRGSDRTTNQWKSKAKSNGIARSDDDGFDQLEKKTSPKKSVQRERPIESAEDSFDDFMAEKRGQREVVQVAAATESDPFAGEADESQESRVPVPEPDRRQKPLAMPTELDDIPAPDSNSSGFDAAPVERVAPLKEPRRTDAAFDADNERGRRSLDSKSNRTSRPARIQQASDFENGLEPAPREERRPAPVTFDDRSFSPESSPRSGGAVSGPSYVIEPSDNFWTISRKRYGAGRYYMALAKHNQQIISDPKRMKPGVAIATPDVSVLEQQYPDLIPKAAPPEPVPSVATTQTRQARKVEDSGPAGFFVSNDGTPMYRVSGQDTLSDIAKSHLGRSSRWVQILEMNRKVLQDGNELKIGTVLRLPPDASRVQVVGTARQLR
ncbi:MAG: LysM peptidoglycan-binding domain-containing protein [Schlesneria sp.]